MTATAHAPPAAPPDDPVRVALEDPAVGLRLRNYALATLRGRLTDADDVVQLVSARAWERRHTFDSAAGSVTGWLFGIAVNVLREMARCPAPTATDPAVLGESLPARLDAEPDHADLRYRVEKHLNMLPTEFRAAVSMRYLDDAEYTEIAERLKVTPVNARMKVSRGLRMLRELAASNSKEERS